MFQYYIKIVPTVYEPLDSAVINTNQFSVTEYYRIIDHQAGGHGIPGAWAVGCVSCRVVCRVLCRVCRVVYVA